MRVIGLCGRKRSGKDTAVSFLAEHGFVRVAFADRLRYLTSLIYGVPLGDFERDDTKEAPVEGSSKPAWWKNAVEQAQKHEGRLTEMFRSETRRGASTKAGFDNLYELDQASKTAPRTFPLDHLYDVQARMRTSNPQGVSPRALLQQMGTEWGRALQSDVWVVWVLRVISQMQDGRCLYDRRTASVRPSRLPAPPGVVISDVRFGNEVTAIQSLGRYPALAPSEVWWIDAEARLPPWTPEHASEPDPALFRGMVDRVMDNNATVDDLREQVMLRLLEGDVP